MNDPRVLPPLPASIRLLTTNESSTLNTRYSASVRTVENCVTCHGAGTFRWFVRGTGRTEVDTYLCDCKRQYILSRYLWHSGVLLRWQRYDWEDLTHFPHVAAEKVGHYLGNAEEAVRRGLGLTITGSKGNGKTLLAHLIIKDLIGKGIDCYSTSYTQMVDTFAEGWRDKDLAQWFNHRLRDVPVLFIDDLGRERNKGPGSVSDNMLETTIRHRLGCQMPTLITTNIEPEKIGDTYGGHTVSLLSECSVVVPVSGPDVRPQMQDRELDEMARGLTRPVTL